MDGCEVEPRYTIEQIDLLQRLRLSGMSKPQIVHALESLERLDCVPAPSQSSSSLSSSSSSSLTPATTQTPSLGASLSPSNSYESSPPPLYPTSTGQRSFCYDLAEEDWDVEEKVEEYMRKDSNMVKEEIKVFLNNRRISQAIVGQVTGISQSYISQWLLQQGLEMSDPKRRAFYRWYLLERSSPGATLTLRPHVKEEPDWRASGSPIGVGAGVVTGGGAMGGAMRLRRGSRFTWRKECLSVMESFFLENQYPDEAKREEIASACNCVIQKPGCKLSECERVTALKVYNWFANRRKDMKRRANIEAAILESHGIEVLSPSCHSNAEEIDIPEFTVAEQVEVSSKDNEQDTVSLSTGMMTLQSTSPLLGNQKEEELKREAADEE